MIKNLLLFVLLVVPCSSFAQAVKTYITSNGTYSADSTLAMSYAIIQRLDGDSAYMVKQYSMHDTIMSIGYYKDDHLSMPNGKFTYYSRTHIVSNGKDSIVNFIQQTGYFLNGQKTGTWVQYASKGVKQSVNNYEYDHLNGPYIVYDNFSGGWTTGTMTNDQNTGSSYMFNADSLLDYELQFKDGKMANYIQHLKDAEPKYDFYNYLEKKLKAYKTQLAVANPLVKYTVSKDGNISDAHVINSVNHQIDSAIAAALITAPPFSPARYNGTVTTINTTRSLPLYRQRYTAYHPFQNSFNFKPPQRIQSGTGVGTTSPRSDGSVLIEYRVPPQ